MLANALSGDRVMASRIERVAGDGVDRPVRATTRTSQPYSGLSGGVMPNRMIRSDLLDSERYWNCSAEARCLYISILLSADDTARCQGSEYFLRTRCLANTVPASRITKLVAELVDEDLIRLYQCGGAQFIFVPRFKQRLRYVNSRHPAPPNEINDLIEKKTVSSQSQDGLKSARSEVEVSPKRSEVEVDRATSTAFLDKDSKRQSAADLARMLARKHAAHD